jgi:hypothetical protein
MKRRTSRSSKRPTAALAFLLASAITVLACGHDAFAQLLPPPPLPLPLPLPLPIPPPNLPLGPPALPTIPSLPQIIPSNAPGPSGSAQLPATSATLDAKILIISADGTEPVLGAIRQAADYEGIPYTLYVASKTPGGFTSAMLSDGGSHAYYQGIVMTTGTLAYFNGTSWTSAFNTTEWQALWDFQAKYRVRTAIAYAYPTADLGYGPPTGVDATTTPITTRLTSSGQSVFSYVNAANPITITKAWTYLAHPSGTGNDVLLNDTAGDALSLVHSYPDGRQVLSMTFDGNFFLVHSLTLAYGTMNWVTGGLFLGERHVYMGPQVDDIFIDDSLYAGGIYRTTGTDWTAVTAWQTQKQLQSQTGGLFLHMAFNGEGTTGEYSLDTLTPTAQLTQSQFPWINHTYSHENLDAASYALAYQQITQNNQIAASMGFANYDTRALVTPDVSGLANPNAMSAAHDAGVRYLVTDTSRPGMDNPTPQAGIYNSYQPDILMIPRRPTNLYYNVTTPTEWTNEYNYLYHTYWGRDLTYSEILDKESDVLLQYMLRGEIDPWMFHESNLRAYDNVHSILGDLLDRALQKYSAICVLPIRSLTHAGIGDWTKARMQYNAAGIQASIAPALGTITITASHAAVVPVTGLCGASAEQYGGQCISHISLSAGQTATLTFGTPSPSQSPTAGVLGGSPGSAGVITAAPNPFNPRTAISFTTTREGQVTARIYDVTGQLVRTLNDGTMASGSHTLVWNGSMENGRLASAGIYFVKVRSPDGESSKRLVFMR